MSKRYKAGVQSALVPLASSYLVSTPPNFFRSEPGTIHPVCDWDMLMLPNFFDHAGNCVNGAAGAIVVIGAGAFVERYVEKEYRKPYIVGVTIAAGTLSSGVNIAYEAGVPMPPFPAPESQFDGTDALYGSVAGILTALVFCTSALRYRSAKKKKG